MTQNQTEQLQDSSFPIFWKLTLHDSFLCQCTDVLVDFRTRKPQQALDRTTAQTRGQQSYLRYQQIRGKKKERISNLQPLQRWNGL